MMASADEPTRRAGRGDRVVVLGRRQGAPQREGEILQVLGERGAPPYLVRWEDGHESEIFPGSDVSIRHVERSDGP